MAEETLLVEETDESLLTDSETDAESPVQEETSVGQESDEPVGAPEEYTEFSLPENFKLNDESVNDFKGLAKELNLTQDQAQKLVDMQSGLATKLAEEQSKVWDETIDKWITDSKSDKEFGGVSFNDNLATAKKGLSIASPKFNNMLSETGIGNHPEMIRFAWQIGKLIEEGKIHVGNNPAEAPRSQAQILFPNMV